MRLPKHNLQTGSVLIIVLWIVFGLVAITLYSANSMNSELRASDNRVSMMAADQTIEGAARYVSKVLTDQATNGVVPYIGDYAVESVTTGESHFWFPQHVCLRITLLPNPRLR